MVNLSNIKMNRLITYLLAGLTIFISTSCSMPYAYRNHPIEVFSPARVILSGPGLKAGIICRNPVVPKDIGSYDTYFSHIELAPSLYHINPVDFHHTETLKNFLNKSDYFESTEYLTEDINPAGDSIRIIPLSPNESRHYFEHYPDKDVLFFLDYLASTANTEYYPDLDYFRHILVTNPVWQIAERSTGRVYLYNRTDTMIWEGFSESVKEIGNLIPKQEIRFLEGAESSAETFSNFLIPKWIVVNRNIYRGMHEDMRQAYNLTIQNHWSEAFHIYEKVALSGNRKNRAMAMYNLALVCEMQDDLEGAANWLLESYFVFEESKPEHARLTKEYLGIIAHRKRDLIMIESSRKP